MVRYNKYSKLAVVSAPVFLFLILFFYWPLIRILIVAFSQPLTSWTQELTSPLFLKFARFTIVEAFLTVCGSLLLGVPAGYFLARGRPFARSLFRSAITVPFIFPPLAVLIGYISVFQSEGQLSGILHHLFSPYSFWGIVVIHILYNVSVVSRIVESAFLSEPQSYHNIAKTLGASRMRRWFTITLPHIRPALEAAMLLVFLYAFNSFAMVLVLGQVKLQTIEVMIYSASRLRLNYPRASILASVQLFMNLVVVVIYSRRRNYSVFEGEEKIPATGNRFGSSFYLFLVVILTWFPIIEVSHLVIDDYLHGGSTVLSQLFSSQFNSLLGASSLRIMFNTLYFGVVVSLIAIFFSALIIFSSEIMTNKTRAESIYAILTILPMGTSAITLSFGLLQTHGRFRFFSEFVFIYIIAAQLIAALPFASRVVFSSWNRLPRGLIDVSRTLGADDFQTFTDVILPSIKSALLVAILFSFAISIGEFGATFFLARGQWVTISLAIEKLIGTQNIILPSAYALFLIGFALLLFLLIERFGELELKI